MENKSLNMRVAELRRQVHMYINAFNNSFMYQEVYLTKINGMHNSAFLCTLGVNRF